MPTPLPQKPSGPSNLRRSPENLETDRKEVRRYLVGAGYSLVLTPLLYWIRYGEVGPLGWGLTVFLTTMCLLVAVGFQFGASTQPVQPAAIGWLDRLGSFWLLACAAGGLAGWVVTSTFLAVTETSWRWQYGARIVFAIVLPVVTMLPLMRYVRGRLALLALGILVLVTLLPVLSGAAYLGDFVTSPVTQVVELRSRDPRSCVPASGQLLIVPCEDVLWGPGSQRVRAEVLLFTRRVLSVEKAD